MEYVIAVFSVRTETMMFNQYLHKLGVNSSIMNTPKEAHTSCGICVKFAFSSLYLVRRINMVSYSSFKGFYKVIRSNMGNIVSKIY